MKFVVYTALESDLTVEKLDALLAAPSERRARIKKRAVQARGKLTDLGLEGDASN